MFALGGLHNIYIFLLLLPTAIWHVMAASDYNPDISNGTCFYSNGQEAPSRFIPCGNVALGHKSCCESLDMCLSSHACYNGQYGVTYLAGCTDPDYEDSACPDKGDFGGMYCFPSSKIHVLTMPTLDQTWAGLVYCNGTSNEWVACQDSGSTISVPSSCWCPSTSRTVAFTDSPILNNIMSLPASQGSSVTWEDVSAYASAHSLTSTSSNPVASSSNSLTQILPPLSVSATLPSTVSPSGQSSLPSSTAAIPPSSTSAAVASTRGGLNTGEKVGIALGSAAAAVILLLLGLLAFRRMRQRQTEESPKPPMMDLTRPISGDAQPDPDMRSPAWSGHKSELAADESTSVSPAPLYQDFTSRPQSVEVESQAARPSPARLTHDGGYTMPGHKGTYYEMAG